MVANVVYTVVIILYEAGKKENDVAQKFRYPMCVVMGFGNGGNDFLLFKKI